MHCSTHKMLWKRDQLNFTNLRSLNSEMTYKISSYLWFSSYSYGLKFHFFFQLNIMSPSSKVGNTLSGGRNSHTTMKSRDRLSSLQVFVTWSVRLLPVNSLQFLSSVVRKRTYCRWRPQVLSWELCRDSLSWHSTSLIQTVSTVSL